MAITCCSKLKTHHFGFPIATGFLADPTWHFSLVSQWIDHASTSFIKVEAPGFFFIFFLFQFSLLKRKIYFLYLLPDDFNFHGNVSTWRTFVYFVIISAVSFLVQNPWWLFFLVTYLSQVEQKTLNLPSTLPGSSMMYVYVYVCMYVCMYT